jgi:sulfate permease, SulP family
VGVLSAGVLAGVVIGVVLSLGWLVYVASSPRMPELGREQGTQSFRELDEYPDDETFPGIAVLRLDSGLFFATAEALDRRLREAIAGNPNLRAIVLDLAGVDFIDSQGSAKLAELHQVAVSEQVTFRLARVKPHVIEMLEADGLLAEIGENRVHVNVYRAVEAQLNEDGDVMPLTPATS